MITDSIERGKPAGTSEETKNKILTVQSDHELTVEESGIRGQFYVLSYHV